MEFGVGPQAWCDSLTLHGFMYVCHQLSEWVHEFPNGCLFSVLFVGHFVVNLPDACFQPRMYYNGRNTSIQERLQSLGGIYPQQAWCFSGVRERESWQILSGKVFRKYDIDQDNHLDKAWKWVIVMMRILLKMMRMIGKIQENIGWWLQWSFVSCPVLVTQAEWHEYSSSCGLNLGFSMG